jgi:hypothetical protein
MRAEKKYIIAKVNGHMRHLSFPSCMYHDTFARDNGIDTFSQVVETGMLVDGLPVIITCKDKSHLERRDYKQHMAEKTFKARAVQTMYMYEIQRDGD